MRQQTALTAEVCAIDEREEAELALIRSHYATQRTPRADRIAALERCVLAIAERLTFAKGKKSVALTWGTIGRRTKPEAVEVADEALALAFAKTLAGGVKVTEKPVLAVVKPAVLARLADGGEEVEGFTIVPEHDLPYLKLTSREDA
jgi:phage host-nuclease inhibitor protein Gam